MSYNIQTTADAAKWAVDDLIEEWKDQKDEIEKLTKDIESLDDTIGELEDTIKDLKAGLSY